MKNTNNEGQHSRAEHPFYEGSVGVEIPPATGGKPTAAAQGVPDCPCPACQGTTSTLFCDREAVMELGVRMVQHLSAEVQTETKRFDPRTVAQCLIEVLVGHVAAVRKRDQNPLEIANWLGGYVSQTYLQCHAYMAKTEAREGVAG
jgi:hypothetical protein